MFCCLKNTYIRIHISKDICVHTNIHMYTKVNVKNYRRFSMIFLSRDTGVQSTMRHCATRRSPHNSRTCRGLVIVEHTPVVHDLPIRSLACFHFPHESTVKAAKAVPLRKPRMTKEGDEQRVRQWQSVVENGERVMEVEECARLSKMVGDDLFNSTNSCTDQRWHNFWSEEFPFAFVGGARHHIARKQTSEGHPIRCSPRQCPQMGCPAHGRETTCPRMKG